MEFIRSLTSLPIETKAGRLNTELNVCGTSASSEVSAYRKMQNPIQITK